VIPFVEKLRRATGENRPGLCVGLDPDPARLPDGFPRDLAGMARFLHQVVEVSAPYAAAYKVNTAFYEAFGADGWRVMEEIAAALPPQAVRLADAKRGDIGNTAQRYAEAFLGRLPFDALTLSPYLGGDSLQPYLRDPAKGAFVLALTTNPGSQDLQIFSDGKEKLYQRVLRLIPQWAPHGNLGAVAGATHPQELAALRAEFPAVPLLIPGVGAQGGDLQAIVDLPYGPGRGPVLVNLSRALLYPGNGLPFPACVAQACREYHRALAGA